MDMVADRVWESRDRTFVEERDGHSLMQTTAIAHLGGATLDNEENYLIKKLFAGGLGMGLCQQSSSYMTQLYRARSGHVLWSGRSDHCAAGFSECRRHFDHGIIHGGKSSRRISVGRRGA